MLEGMGVLGREGERGGKKWDNCNSIINKIYLQKDVTNGKLSK